MAAGLPVKDVLCEAMDYLSKLGSNLQTRSETLKDKRKDKLNNAIAVQKAADKVLLICELSKKSLANVEAGVRKILEQIAVSQASSGIGGKSSSRTDSRKVDKHNYHYFDYKSRKLKIKTKISLKHYKSVKVLARKMTLSMIDRYPVYSDCKLYRKRKQETQNTIDEKMEGNIESFALICENSKTIESKYDTIKKMRYKDSNDSDMEQDNKPNNNNSGKEDQQESDQSEKEPEPKKRRTENEDKLEVSDAENVKESKSNNEKYDAESDSSTKSGISNSQANFVKPMIKCVSLTKLLKPDVIKEVINIPDETSKVQKLNANKKRFNVAKKNQMLDTAKKNKDEFWSRKRKEVIAFQSKEFSVNIIRLPKLCAKFLKRSNIMKVTKEGKTLYEITKNNSESSSDTEFVKKKQKDKSASEDELQLAEANKVKKSLLHESDSDNERVPISRLKSARKKRAPIDSDENDAKENEEKNFESNEDTSKLSDDEAAKKDLLGSSDSDDSNAKTNKSPEAAKKDLLKHSDSDDSNGKRNNISRSKSARKKSVLIDSDENDAKENEDKNGESNDDTSKLSHDEAAKKGLLGNSDSNDSNAKTNMSPEAAKKDLLEHSDSDDSNGKRNNISRSKSARKKSAFIDSDENDAKENEEKNCESNDDTSQLSHDKAAKKDLLANSDSDGSNAKTNKSLEAAKNDLLEHSDSDDSNGKRNNISRSKSARKKSALIDSDENDAKENEEKNCESNDDTSKLSHDEAAKKDLLGNSDSDDSNAKTNKSPETAKNDLLEHSDSDDSNGKRNKIPETANNDLLGKSDSDDSNGKTKKSPGTAKKDLVGKSDSDDSNGKTNKSQEAAKKDLLDHPDSDDDNGKTSKSSKAVKKHLLNQSDSVDSNRKTSNCIENIEETNKSCDDNLNDDKNNSDNVPPVSDQETSEKEEEKKSLLNNSFDDETAAPLNQRKVATPQSKKKRMHESVHAKHALLRNSSSSETEDEQLRNTLNEIKKSLLEGMSDDENKVKANHDAKKRSKKSSSFESDIGENKEKTNLDPSKSLSKSSSSESDIPLKVKKTKIQACKMKRRKKRSVIKSDSDEDTKKNSSDDDDKPTSSSSKMVRSKSKPGSSLSSDNKDHNDRDIDGLTNLKTLHSSRRPNSDDTDESDSTNSTAKSRMAKRPTGVIGEEILKAESSSDAASIEEGEDVDEGRNVDEGKKPTGVIGEEILKAESSSDAASIEEGEDVDEGKKPTGVIGEEILKAESSSDAASIEEGEDVDEGKKPTGVIGEEILKAESSSDAASIEEGEDVDEGKKPTGVIGEEILKAESSSDAASIEEGEDVDEDLPPVNISAFNGGLQHLVKEDLLGDSDSSVSNKDEKNDESDEEQLNPKRRKQIAISSDSDTAARKKKDHDKDVKLSDFEDSDNDSEINKRSKRRKKGTDSDVSGDSSDANKQKKRRRIKTVDDSDASGSDSENEGKNKHGRKNIRKVMGKSQLEEATKKAAREEKERVARIAERQKMYNNLQFDESGKPDEVVLDRVVLDFDPETKEPLIAVDRGLVKKLKPHQANGIKFMWDACFESVKRIKKAKGSGCILAHCMGLGKTLQVVALTHTLLAHSALTKTERVLVVCPLSTVLNWVNEFKMWLRHAEREKDIQVYELSRFKQNSERAFQLSQWFEYGGVCVLGYEMFRNLSADNNKKFKKKMLKSFQEALVDPGPDLVVCDEGHLLKNEKTSLSQSMNKVKTLRRIVLTGTPLQNNLKEYYCMVTFVKPNLLGKYNEYLNRFVNPITNGQYTDSTEHDIKIMKRRSHVLHKMLDGAVQRRDYGVLAPYLPPKHEYVLFITLTDVQVKLYQHYLDNYSRKPQPGKSSGFLFPDFQSLQRIWTHPLVLKYNSERYEIMQQKKRDKEEEEEDSEGSLIDFIDDDSTPAESTSEDSSDVSSVGSDDSRKKSKKKKKSSKKSKGKDKDKEAGASRRRGTRANPIDLDLEGDKDNDLMEVKNENPTEWWVNMVVEDELEDMRNSHKLVLLFDILRQCEAIGDKLLVFSQSLYSLDLIEHFLGKVDEATQESRIDDKLGGHVGSWSSGTDYFRLDGSTSCENRSIWCKHFNREDNPRARLFLISTRAGGLGINLVAANRVVIFDVSWNPSHDVQSIFRVYRFGQKKPCYVYRFLAMGTMEEKIYERQVTKQAISKRVIDEQQIDRHYAENDLAELYKFEAEPPSPRPIPPLPKDRLFAEMLREHDKQIYRYHEHDSLLENKEEETLSEEERKAAWDDFENEKNRPPPAPFASPWPMNGMMPNMLAQQQQQLAYAALAAMLRKDMPNVNDNQIRDMLPMIYNANPGMFGGYDYGLMQKMSDMYKYTQQMNMASGMMGQGSMNSAGSAAIGGMGGGSSSGLQYEPPWLRQQKQQQQLRLQQLMAQQQNMGAAAKFYAGGLGSRDPVAMALQQQRAREIMVGGAGSRPRGRPPLQPRAPTGAADVVNLDSD